MTLPLPRKVIIEQRCPHSFISGWVELFRTQLDKFIRFDLWLEITFKQVLKIHLSNPIFLKLDVFSLTISIIILSLFIYIKHKRSVCVFVTRWRICMRALDVSLHYAWWLDWESTPAPFSHDCIYFSDQIEYMKQIQQLQSLCR